MTEITLSEQIQRTSWTSGTCLPRIDQQVFQEPLKQVNSPASVAKNINAWGNIF